MNKKYLFLTLFTISLVLMYYLYMPFLMDLVIAAVLCMATFGLKVRLLKILKYETLACASCILILLIAFVAPVFFVVYSLFDMLKGIEASYFNAIIEGVKIEILTFLDSYADILPEAKEKGAEMLAKISGAQIFPYILKYSSSIGKWSVSFFADTCFVLIFLFFLYYYGTRLYEYMLGLVKFEKLDYIFLEVRDVARVVIFTSIINVVLQGLSFGVMLSFFGYDGVFFGILYGFCSLVPVVGGGLVWIPVALYQVFLGDYDSAIFIALYSLVFIAFIIDSIIKPLIIRIVNNRILKTTMTINEFVIFFAILAGIAAFGFWGIILGPIITAFFIALLRVYENFLMPQNNFEIQSNQNRQSGAEN